MTIYARLLFACLIAFTSAHAETLRDPTQPPSARLAPRETAAAPALRLEAIFSSAGQRSAIVDGKLVRRGDRVGEALIEDITSDTVRYSRAGRSQVVRLHESNVRVRRSSTAQKDES